MPIYGRPKDIQTSKLFHTIVDSGNDAEDNQFPRITDDPQIYTVVRKILLHSKVVRKADCDNKQPTAIRHVGSGVAGCCFLVTKGSVRVVVKIFKKKDLFEFERDNNEYIWGLMKGKNEYNMHMSLWSGFGQFDGIMYAILKYRGLSMSDLDKLVPSIQQGTLQRIVDSFKSMASYLPVLHSHGVFHTDVKQDNLTIDREGNAFLIDWGNAFIKEINGQYMNCDMTYNHLPCPRLVPRSVLNKIMKLTDNRHDYPIVRDYGAFTLRDFAVSDVYGMVALFSTIINRLVGDRGEFIGHFRGFIQVLMESAQPRYRRSYRAAILNCMAREVLIPVESVMDIVTVSVATRRPTNKRKRGE